MQKAFTRMKGIGITATIMFAIDIAVLFVFAVGVHYGKLQLSHCGVLLPIAIILSAMIAAYRGTKICDDSAWLILAGVIFAAAAMIVLSAAGGLLELSGGVKAIIAAVIGVFLGNFFKKRTHNRLRKNKKKRRNATK